MKNRLIDRIRELIEQNPVYATTITIFWSIALVATIVTWVTVFAMWRHEQHLTRDTMREHIASQEEVTEQISLMREDINAVRYHDPPDSLYLFGRAVPFRSIDRPDLNKRIHDLWGRYLAQRQNTTELVRRSVQYADRVRFVRQLADEKEVHPDVLYLIIHEAWFNDYAVSTANAVGSCQFMRETALANNLEINGAVDERRSFILCADNTLDHLKDLFERFLPISQGDSVNAWHLAAAAYNAGGARITRTIARADGAYDYFALRAFLPSETSDYIPKIAIEKEIITNRDAYGFRLTRAQEIQTICSVSRQFQPTSRMTVREVVEDSLGLDNYNTFYHCNPHVQLRDPENTFPPHRGSSGYTFFLPEDFTGTLPTTVPTDITPLDSAGSLDLNNAIPLPKR